MGDASLFRTLWPEARTLLDGGFGEQVIISPRARKAGDPNARSIADPNRPETTVIGIWDDTPIDAAAQSRMLPEKAVREVSDADVVLTIAKARLPFAPVQGDRVTRMLTAESFAVASVEDNGETEWIINLSARGG